MKTYYSVYIDSDCYCEVSNITMKDLKAKLLSGLNNGSFKDGALVRILKDKGSRQEIFRYVMWNRGSNTVRLIPKNKYNTCRVVSDSDEILREFLSSYGKENVLRVGVEELNWSTGYMERVGWCYKIKVKDIYSMMVRSDICRKYGISRGMVTVDKVGYEKWVSENGSGYYYWISVNVDKIFIKDEKRYVRF